MTTVCIEVVSSDDEVQVIEIFEDNIPKKCPSASALNPSSFNALQKLQRNSNIQLSINSSSFEDLKQNGVTYNAKTSPTALQEKEKEASISRNSGHESDSDVIIVDSPVLPVRKRQPIKRRSSTKRQDNSQDVRNDKTPKLSDETRRPQNHVKTETSFVKDPIQDDVLNSIVYIIDDNSDEERENALQSQTPKINCKESKSLNKRQSNPVPNNDNAQEQLVSNTLQKHSVSEKVQENPISHTEQLVNALREKIENKKLRESFKNITNRQPTISYNTKDDKAPKSSKPSAKNTPGRSNVRLAPEPVINSSNDKNYPNSKFRLSSSLSSPSPGSDQPSSSHKSVDVSEKQSVKPCSVENVFRGLVKACHKIFTDNSLETKLWGYFKKTPDEMLKSDQFMDALKSALKILEETNVKSFDEKLLSQKKVKDVIHLMKRQPAIVDRKVRRLMKTLNVIRGRIRKLEETEVTSDEEDENSYILLDRYRGKATKIYEKISELQGTPSHAGRVLHQKFHFNGSSGFNKIEDALEKFYHKTKCFPDFFDVKTLVEATVKKENINIPAHNIHTVAQSIFLEFGNKLKRMRCYDEYMILQDYIEDGHGRDPAACNTDLRNDLEAIDSRRRIMEGEKKILEEYSLKQVELKKNSETTNPDDSTSDEDTKSDVVGDNKELPNLHFSDTDEELFNDEDDEKRRKMSLSEDDGVTNNQ